MTLSVEIVESVLRVFHGGGDANHMDAFDATGTVHYHGDVAVLYGVHGKLKLRDIIDSYKACRDGGARWLLAHRKDGHTIPMGNIMPDGHPFAGWWYVDLNEVK